MGTHKCSLGPGELNIHPEMRLSKLEIDSTLYSRVAAYRYHISTVVAGGSAIPVPVPVYGKLDMHRPKD